MLKVNRIEDRRPSVEEAQDRKALLRLLGYAPLTTLAKSDRARAPGLVSYGKPVLSDNSGSQSLDGCSLVVIQPHLSMSASSATIVSPNSPVETGTNAVASEKHMLF